MHCTLNMKVNIFFIMAFPLICNYPMLKSSGFFCFFFFVFFIVSLADSKLEVHLLLFYCVFCLFVY